MILLQYLFKGFKFFLLILNIYFLYLAKDTNNYVAFTFLMYIFILLIFPYFYRIYQWYSKEKAPSFIKFMMIYISFISVSTLLFIVIQWYVIDSIGLKDLYRNLQENFTQAYQAKR